MKRVTSDEVDLSRVGKLVHSADSYGREVILVSYIEGLQGDETRYARQYRIGCHTVGQARELARVLREALFNE